MEVTAPRIPCAVFATRMGEPDWVKRFADARRPGLYVRVLEPGEVAAGDPVQRLGGLNGHPHPTVVDLMDVWYDREPDPALLERLLASPLAERARANVASKLARAPVGLKIELEPDAALAVLDHTPAAGERVQEREPSTRLALRAWHHDVVGDEPATPVSDLHAGRGSRRRRRRSAPGRCRAGGRHLRRS